MITSRIRSLAILALVLSSGGCVATRSDVRILQGDIFALRGDVARSDSARRRELLALTGSLNTTLATLRDSIEAVSERLGKFQGDARQEFYAISQQLLVLGELTGQGQRRITELRAELENRSQQMATPPAVSPGDTAAPPAGGAAPQIPGPAQLWLIGRQQLDQKSYGAARDAFQTLLQHYPTSEMAAGAQLSIAESFAAENRALEADSANRVVFEKYPQSPAAPTAMYRLGLSLGRQGKRSEARGIMTRVAQNYPRTDEADLARDWLQRNP